MFDGLKQWVTGKNESTGDAGERAAEQFLKREKGFRIVERNWRNGKEEILVFVEVKTRRSGGLVPGFYSVNKRKKRALKRAARAYLRTFRNRPNTFRLDVVEVNYKPDEAWEILALDGLNSHQCFWHF
jgi:putative endonuclease